MFRRLPIACTFFGLRVALNNEMPAWPSTPVIGLASIWIGRNASVNGLLTDFETIGPMITFRHFPIFLFANNVLLMHTIAALRPSVFVAYNILYLELSTDTRAFAGCSLATGAESKQRWPKLFDKLIAVNLNVNNSRC